MPKRTTIEIDPELLARAKRTLGRSTTRETVEVALRLAADSVEFDRAERAERQRDYLGRLGDSADLAVLGSEEMWR